MDATFRFFRYALPVVLLLTVFVSTGGRAAVPEAGGFQTGSVGQAGEVYLPLVFGQPPVPEGTLANGGVVTGPEGVQVGAPGGSLAAPVEVIFASPGPPTTTLPAPVQPLGSAVKIAAASSVYTTPENPLILAFPVPPGADTAHLALGVLSSGLTMNDVYDPALNWAFLEGLYDAAEGMFLTADSALTTEGATYWLVEHPDFDSPAPAAAAQGAGQAASDYAVLCVNFINPADCTPSTQDEAAVLLAAFEARLQGELGFAPPRLRRLYTNISLDPPVLTPLAYKAYIEPSDLGHCASAGAGGYYDPEKARLVLCLNPAVGINDDYIQILLHEFFHATEYGYPAVMDDRAARKEKNFVIEGMAKAVEESFYTPGQTLKRSELGGWVELHPVDLALDWNFGLIPYFAQDFWVYYGQQYGKSLPYFQDILGRGSETRDVVDTLGAGEYLETYWPWVKNQVMEATNTLDGKLTSPCQLEMEAALLPEIFNFKSTSYEEMRHETTVGPLTTAVVKVQFDYNYDVAAGVVFPTNPDPAGLANMALEYKMYKDGEGGCDQVPDGNRIFEDVKTADVYYVLVTNKEISRSWDYTVFFEVDPIP